MYTTNDNLWGIILAGGEGRRLREFIRTRYHSNVPKQYCTFIGTRSMLRHTIDRCEMLIPPERLLTIISRHHLQYAQHHLYDRPSGTVIIQPYTRETASGILYPLLHIHTREPDALVAIFPSDHFVLKEDRFMDYVRFAAEFIEYSPHSMVLLGVEPDHPEKEYGWIEINSEIRHDKWKRIFTIRRFIEKPDAFDIQFAGKNLWNTMVCVCRVHTLLDHFRTLTPNLYETFQRIKNLLGSSREKDAVEKIFTHLAPVNFSRALLEKNPEGLCVLRMDDVYWNDWGNPERILSDLRRLTKPILFRNEVAIG